MIISCLSDDNQNRLMELFIAGSTARTASSLISNLKTSMYYFRQSRELLYEKGQSVERFKEQLDLLQVNLTFNTFSS